ncbi:cytochrome C oxidase subunit IV family protein [Candidatus Uabimicrobium sp. HlEnr_7]|uniref:cytochrome C oxidase subunit IV family protein n=1 Tax=Candidatus Uabimicrobium helgolandensis TaxID=3095367 RepID=UPI003556BFA8
MDHAEHHEEHPMIGYGTYISIWLALLILTALTVAIAGFDLGKYTTLVAMVVATVKTTLVGLYFMHLRYEPKVFHYMILVTFMIMVVIVIFTFIDGNRFSYLSHEVQAEVHH